MLKNFLSTIFVTTSLLSMSNINELNGLQNDANIDAAMGEFNNFIHVLAATGDVNTFCYKMKCLAKHSFNPEIKKGFQEMGFSDKTIHSLKKGIKKFIKAFVYLIKVEARLEETRAFSKQQKTHSCFQRLLIARMRKNVGKKWNALMEEMKQNNMSKQNA